MHKIQKHIIAQEMFFLRRVAILFRVESKIRSTKDLKWVVIATGTLLNIQINRIRIIFAVER